MAEGFYSLVDAVSEAGYELVDAFSSERMRTRCDHHYNFQRTCRRVKGRPYVKVRVVITGILQLLVKLVILIIPDK